MPVDYDAAYEYQYTAFTRHSKEHAKSVEVLDTWIGSLVDSVQNKKLRVLSVGTANGGFDLPLIESLIGKLPSDIQIKYTCVDPNDVFNGWFKEEATKKFTTSKIEFEFLANKMDDDLMDNWISNKIQFDVILFCQAFSLMSDHEAALQKINKELLSSKGQCIIVQVLEKESFRLFTNIMNCKVYCAYSETLLEEEMSYEDFVTNPIENVVKTLNMKYDKITYESSVDLSPCFDENSVDGNLMLDFIISKEHSRKELNGKIIEKILNLLKDYCEKDTGNSMSWSSEYIAIKVMKQ